MDLGPFWKQGVRQGSDVCFQMAGKGEQRKTDSGRVAIPMVTPLLVLTWGC
jgi:hypothetical protein